MSRTTGSKVPVISTPEASHCTLGTHMETKQTKENQEQIALSECFPNRTFWRDEA